MSQYFINDDSLKSNEKIIKVNFDNKVYSFYTDNGVFAKNSFDYGSRLLMNTLPIKDMIGRVLDLGCGYGIVGIMLKSNNKLLEVDMVDINNRAIVLSNKNIKLNNVEAHIMESDVYSKINNKYDYIITNPPIRAGKDIVKRFLFGAKDYLSSTGQLWFVMHKDHGVKTMIKEISSIYDIEVKEKDKGFYIVCATFKKEN